MEQARAADRERPGPLSAADRHGASLPSYRIELPRGAFAAAVAAFTLLPLAELMLLLWLGSTAGWLPTLALCAATGFAGAWLARSQGLKTALAAQQALAEGSFPSRQLFDGACLLAGGVVLLTPGLVTDALGFALLLPPTRAALRTALQRWWRRRQGIIDV